MYQARIHVAHPLLLCSLLFLVRSCLSWHYPNSPKKRKNALSPRHDWLQRGSELIKDPLRIWFYPQ
ncbi:serine/threonine protein kinase [Salmonella enterica subsp. enterica serovar Oranienburg]|uniref:Serine/threonine protein kinase n=1 Tax=Salmonella enterica I TaxID=59201 RepID=A0A3R0XJY5_SALET|nr:serine/threonine protein kinase [Salmonella enterica subsp. enterica serovar Oranienburg]EDV3838435.1 serine/threonine protein kinase [Salmonella enterica subsp. diarizonae]EED9398121.1 serine/threonine protein kinase [Salmonella enterica subsp. enterica serovar Oranienburg]MLU99879.1 serine/threonine protein kinase [Salmonella enterica subsp. enterica serovar Oranienburg]